MLNENIRKEIQRLGQAKKSLSEISRILDVPFSTVRNIIKKSTTKHKLKAGRPSKIDQIQKKRINQAVRSLKIQGKKVTSTKLLKSSNLNVSPSTVRRHLVKQKFKYKILPKIVQLDSTKQEKRIEIIKSWIKEGTSFYKVIFSDEKVFSMDGPNNFKSWCQKNETSTRIRRQCGGGGLMVFGYVLSNGTVNIIKIEGTLTSAKYVEMIKTFISDIKEKFPDYIFMQDNARAHTAKNTIKFFEEKSVKLLKWPPYSPDLNIMENIWAIISETVYNGPQYRCKDDLFNAIQNATSMITQDTIMKLYDDIPNRICSCIRLNGNIIV